MYLKEKMPEEEHADHHETCRILVVEDDPEISDLLTIFIKKYGYHPCGVAETGEDAIRLIEKTSPDIVCIDIVLKGPMNGIDLARHINKEFRIPFIYITGYSDEQIINRVIHTYPSAFILKPFKGEEIRVAVEIIKKQISQKKHKHKV